MKQLILLSFLLISVFGFAQTANQKQAHKLAKEGIALFEKGEYDKSIRLFEKAEKLEPENYQYRYEIGYAYLLKKEYKKAIVAFEKVVKFQNITAQCFQMLGNTYDMGGDSKKANKAYLRGLKKFPNAGRLFLELGNVQLRTNANNAIRYYERGVTVDPTYSSNYYRLTKVFLEHTENEVWGMIYGEIFMNIERDTKRTAEISKLLYDTYKSEITFKSKKKMTVSFCKDGNIIMTEDGKITLPFGLLVYEKTLTLALIGTKTINLSSLNTTRNNFTDIYFKNGDDKKHPNLIFEWQKELANHGFIEAYNYWLLMKGNPTEFNQWVQNNKSQYEKFSKWFQENPLKITSENKFVRNE